MVLQILSRKKLAGWMGGNWVDGWESGFKDCLQQSKTQTFQFKFVDHGRL